MSSINPLAKSYSPALLRGKSHLAAVQIDAARPTPPHLLRYTDQIALATQSACQSIFQI